MGSVTLTEEQVELIADVLRSADQLVSLVIRGDKGQQTAALAVARGLTELNRRKTFGLLGMR